MLQAIAKFMKSQRPNSANGLNNNDPNSAQSGEVLTKFVFYNDDPNSVAVHSYTEDFGGYLGGTNVVCTQPLTTLSELDKTVYFLDEEDEIKQLQLPKHNPVKYLFDLAEEKGNTSNNSGCLVVQTPQTEKKKSERNPFFRKFERRSVSTQPAQNTISYMKIPLDMLEVYFSHGARKYKKCGLTENEEISYCKLGQHLKKHNSSPQNKQLERELWTRVENKCTVSNVGNTTVQLVNTGTSSPTAYI